MLDETEVQAPDSGMRMVDERWFRSRLGTVTARCTGGALQRCVRAGDVTRRLVSKDLIELEDADPASELLVPSSPLPKRVQAVFPVACSRSVGRTSIGRCVVTALPVTSKVERIYPFQVLLSARKPASPGIRKPKAKLVRSVAIERVGERIRILTRPDLAELDEAMGIHLAPCL